MTDQPRDLAAEAAEISRIHDQGRYDQYGEHASESIGTLLDQIAALSRELEEATQAGIDTAREVSETLNGRIDEFETENERLQSENRGLHTEIELAEQELGKALGYPWYKDDKKSFPDATEEDGVCVGECTAASLANEAALRILSLQSELTALRRPAEQGAEVENIRQRRAISTKAYVSMPWQMMTDVDELLSALDAAQREIQDLRCPADCEGDRHACNVCGTPVRYGERHTKCGQSVMALEKEIARLSSPPQERADIVERQSSVRKEFDSYGWLCLSTAENQMRDVGTLLGDCAAWRNAVTVANATIATLRDRIGELIGEKNEYYESTVDKDRDLADANHQLLLANNNAAAFQRVAERHKRAIDWLLRHGAFRRPDGVIEYRAVSADMDLTGAEFSDIIKPTAGASN